jgi:hypothetical protein
VADYAPGVEFAGARFRISPIGPPREFYLTGEKPQFQLEVTNLGSASWIGRVPLLWVQGGANWCEPFDVSLTGGNKATPTVQSHWLSSTGMLECRLPMDKTPQEFLAMKPEEVSRSARASNYLVLCSVQIRDRAEVAREEIEGYRSLYSPFSAEALSYVALTITTVGIQIAVVVGAISSSKLLSVPWPLFLVVIGAVGLSFVFAMAAIARFELLAHLTLKGELQNLPTMVSYEARNEPLPHRFMRRWFDSERVFFGFGQNEKPPGRWARFLRWVSSGRVAGPLIALALFNGVMLYVLWPHVAWCLQSVCL